MSSYNSFMAVSMYIIHIVTYLWGANHNE
jgi:hypothetical protein